jgi:hypothetical protein
LMAIVVVGVLLLVALGVVCLAAYMINAESFEFSTAILRLVSFSIKVRSPGTARRRRDGDGGTKGRDGTPRDEQPPLVTEQKSKKPVVILLADEFRITEVLGHIEAGEIVLIIPTTRQRGPPPE